VLCLTATYVAGRNVIVRTAIDFMMELSICASKAMFWDDSARLRLILLLVWAKWLFILSSIGFVSVQSTGS